MNFGGSEVVYDYSSSRIIILPVPYDGTSTWIKGADRGPGAIMEASVNLEFYDLETDSEVHLNGIHTLDPLPRAATPEELVQSVRSAILRLIEEKKFPVVVGGNHTVSIGSIRAFAETFDRLSVLQLDAHADLRNEYNGSALNHACAMARAKELVPVVQVGIRSISAEEVAVADKNYIFPAHILYKRKDLYLNAIDMLTDNVYVTVDLDVFDPSLIPTTGTPEPGGPDYYEIMGFIREVAARRNIVGFDVVELCPSSENKAPDFVAARLIYQMLSYIFKERSL